MWGPKSVFSLCLCLSLAAVSVSNCLCLSVTVCVWLADCLCLAGRLSVWLYVCLVVCLFLFVYLFVCLFLFLFASFLSCLCLVCLGCLALFDPKIGLTRNWFPQKWGQWPTRSPKEKGRTPFRSNFRRKKLSPAPTSHGSIPLNPSRAAAGRRPPAALFDSRPDFPESPLTTRRAEAVVLLEPSANAFQAAATGLSEAFLGMGVGFGWALKIGFRGG